MIRSLDSFIPGQHRPWTPEVMEVAADKPLMVDHDDFLLSAQFTRQGSDLLLEGGVDYPGHSVLIPGYFSMAEPPDLVTSYHARITADLAHMLAGPMVPSVYAENAAPVAPTTAVSGGDGIGRVESVEKGATIVRAGVKMAAVKGMAIQQGDIIETVKGGGVGLVYADDTTISLANSGRMVVEEMKYDPAKGEGRSTTNVVQGEFSFVSGHVAKLGTDRMVFKTPVAVIGVRGTTVAGKASAEGSENSFTLLPDADGGVGKIAVTNQTGTIILSQPNQTTTLTSFTIKPTAPIILSPQEIQSRYGGATRILPPPPAATQGSKTGSDGGDAAAKGGDGQPGGENKTGGDGEKAPDGENQPKGEGDAPPKGGPGEGGEAKPAPGEEGKPPLPGQENGGLPQGGGVVGGQPGAMAGPQVGPGEQPGATEGPQPISLANAQQGAMGVATNFSNAQPMNAKPLGLNNAAFSVDKTVTANPMAPSLGSAMDQANRSVLPNVNDGLGKIGGSILKANTVVGPPLETISTVPPTDDTQPTPPSGGATSTPIVPPVPIVVQPEPIVVQPEPIVVPPEPIVVPPVPIVVPPEPIVVPPEPIVVPPEPIVVPPEPIVVPPEPIVVPPEPIVVPPEPIVVPPEPIVVPPVPIVVPPEPIVVPPEPIVVPPEPIVVPPEPIVVPPEPIVVPVASPTLAVQDTFGSHDHPFHLPINAALASASGTEKLSIVVDGLPTGSTLSAGGPDAAGHWILTPEQLNGLSMSLPQGAPDTFSLTVTATATETAGGNTAHVTGTMGIWQGGHNDLFYMNYSYSPAGPMNESALSEHSRVATGPVTMDTLNQGFIYQETMASDNFLAPSSFGSYVQQPDGQFNLALTNNVTNNVIAHGAISENGSLGMYFSSQESYQTATPNTTMGLLIPDGIGLNNASFAGEYRFAYLEDNPNGPITSYGKVTLDGAGKGTAVEQAASDGHPTTTLFTYSVQDNGKLLITDADGTVNHGKISPDGEVFVISDFSTSSPSVAVGLRSGTGVQTHYNPTGEYTFGNYNTYIYNSPNPAIIYNNWNSKVGIISNEGVDAQEYQMVSDGYFILGSSKSKSTDADGWLHMNDTAHPSHDSIGILSSDGSILVTVDAQLSSADHSDGNLGLGIAIRQDTVGSMWQGGAASSGTLVSKILIDQGVNISAGIAGIAVTDAPNMTGVGHWQYTLDGGSAWSDFGSVTSNSAQVLAWNSATKVRFVPDANYTGDAVLHYHTWDGSGGFSNGQAGVNVVAKSGASGFGNVEESAVIAIKPTLLGGPFDAIIHGVETQDNNIAGTPGNDLLLGKSGDDSLWGDAGGDVLVGGGGSNIFDYFDASDSQGSSVDTIVDFNKSSTNTINFAPSMITGSFNYIGNTAFHGVAHTEARFDTASETLQVDLDGNGMADMVIQMPHVTLVDLSSTDFTST